MGGADSKKVVTGRLRVKICQQYASLVESFFWCYF